MLNLVALLIMLKVILKLSHLFIVSFNNLNFIYTHIYKSKLERLVLQKLF